MSDLPQHVEHGFQDPDGTYQWVRGRPTNPQGDGMTHEVTQSEVDEEVARRLAALGVVDPEAMRKAVAAIHAAWGEVRTAVLNARELMGAGMTAAERAKRRDTLHREAAAALGRGDRKAHRRALDDLRFLNKTETP